MAFMSSWACLCFYKALKPEDVNVEAAAFGKNHLLITSVNTKLEKRSFL